MRLNRRILCILFVVFCRPRHLYYFYLCPVAAHFQNLHRQINQPLLRFIGAALLALAISSTFFWIWPTRVFEFPMGSGGILGVGVFTFLHSHFAAFGTFLLLLAVWIVAGLLVADDLVVMMLQYIGIGFVKAVGLIAPAWKNAIEHSENVKDIWHRLSLKQKNLTPQEQLLASLKRNRQSLASAQTLPAPALQVKPVNIKEIKTAEKIERTQSAQIENLLPQQPTHPQEAEKSGKSIDKDDFA